jgi:hypothetical protein
MSCEVYGSGEVKSSPTAGLQIAFALMLAGAVFVAAAGNGLIAQGKAPGAYVVVDIGAQSASPTFSGRFFP